MALADIFDDPDRVNFIADAMMGAASGMRRGDVWGGIQQSISQGQGQRHRQRLLGMQEEMLQQRKAQQEQQAATAQQVTEALQADESMGPLARSIGMSLAAGHQFSAIPGLLRQNEYKAPNLENIYRGNQVVTGYMTPEGFQEVSAAPRWQPQSPSAPKPPQTREIKRGGEIVTQEWGGEGWQDVSTAPRSTKQVYVRRPDGSTGFEPEHMLASGNFTPITPGGGPTAAQQANNEETLAARRNWQLKGLDAELALAASQSATNTGLPNPNYDPNVERLARLAARPLEGVDDPGFEDFFKRVYGEPKAPPMQAGGGIDPAQLQHGAVYAFPGGPGGQPMTMRWNGQTQSFEAVQ